MSGICTITGKRTVTVNHVSHSNRKVKSKSKSNVSFKNIAVEFANTTTRLKVSAAAMRTIDQKNGLARHLLSVSRSKLNPQLRKIRNTIIYNILNSDVEDNATLKEVKEKLQSSRSGRKLPSFKCRHTKIKNQSITQS